LYILGRNDFFCDENSKSNREIEPGPFLLDSCRSQIHGNFLGRKMETRILECRAHAISALPHRRIRETDDRELWKPSANIDFHLDQMRIDTDECSAQHFCKHGSLRSKAWGCGIIGILSNRCNRNYKRRLT